MGVFGHLDFVVSLGHTQGLLVPRTRKCDRQHGKRTEKVQRPGQHVGQTLTFSVHLVCVCITFCIIFLDAKKSAGNLF